MLDPAMRWLAVLALLMLLAPALAPLLPTAEARPEFARREAKACGFCHINPRGGGARNRTGLRYARNEFSFPTRAGDLSSFEKERDRAAMVRARKLLEIAHTRAAVEQLRRLERTVTAEAARQRVRDQLHALDVKGTEILGRARQLLRGSDREQGVELIVLLTVEYKGLDIHSEASTDLKELKAQKELRPLVQHETKEARARLLYLEGLTARLDGKPEKARKTFARVLKAHPGTRAAELAKAELPSTERAR
jgi:hypothetical protein